MCSASSRYWGEEGPLSGPIESIFWIFFKASTLREGSLLRIVEIVSVMPSGPSSRGGTSIAGGVGSLGIGALIPVGAA